MAIDMSNLEFGEELVAGQEYAWRITGVWVKQSENTGSLFINMQATVADGPSMGQEARVPMIMLYHPAYPGRTGRYLVEAANKLSKYLGIPPTSVILPQAAGESTETIDALINSLHVSKAKWVEEKTGNDGRVYEAHWETGYPTKALAEDEVEVQGDQYAAFFTD